MDTTDWVQSNICSETIRMFCFSHYPLCISLSSYTDPFILPDILYSSR